MNYTDQLIWQYIDGECTEAERMELEALLKKDKKLQREVQEARQLHQQLQQLEPEQPSLRFSVNVMEQLPPLARRLWVEPFVPESVIRRFLAVMTGLFALFFILLLLSRKYYPEQTESTTSQAFETIAGSIAAIPQQWLVLVIIAASGTLLLLLLDRFLQSRFQF